MRIWTSTTFHTQVLFPLKSTRPAGMWVGGQGPASPHLVTFCMALSGDQHSDAKAFVWRSFLWFLDKTLLLSPKRSPEMKTSQFHRHGVSCPCQAPKHAVSHYGLRCRL